MQAKYVPKIQNAISRAISFLDQIANHRKTESESMAQALWHAAEETEYAAAVLSLTHGLTDLDPEFKEDDVQKAEMDKQVSFARNLLMDSLELLENRPTLCYEKLRHAVQLLRKIQAETLGSSQMYPSSSRGDR